MDFFESDQFADHVAALMAEHHVPGLSIAIALRDSATASRAFGHASVEGNTPCTPETLFDIASSAKSLTAGAVALLVDDNENHPKVQYDALMHELLPDDFVMPYASYTNGITVEDVLSHRTGMASHDNSYMGSHAAQPDDARSITRNLRNLAVAAPLRSRYLYCNMMYTVATHLVETETKQPFADFLEDRIFKPVGMESSALQPNRARRKGVADRLAKGHIWNKDSYQEIDSSDCPEGQGAGSIISSANDFIRWIKALMNRETPINDKIYQGLTKMRSIVNPMARRLKPHTTPAIYTAGMEMYFYRGEMVIGHDGNIPGFGSRFVFLPEKRFGIVVMGNSSGAGAVCSAVVRALMDEVIQVPMSERALRSKPKPKKIPVRPGRPAKPDEEADKANKTEKQGSAAPSKPGQKKGDKTPKRTGKSLPPQEKPLEMYAGKFTNPGYKTVTVEIRDDKLFVDASDRGMGFTLTFEHKGDQKEYVAHLFDTVEGGDDPIDAEFVFEDDKVVSLGLDLEPAVKDLIWFRRA